MKNITSKFSDDFKPIECIPKHHNLVNKYFNQNDPIFPGFFKKKVCRHSLNDQYDIDINKS